MSAVIKRGLIEEIIQSQGVTAVFQPIVSIKKGSIVGLEALCRGLHKENTVMPESLFEEACRAGLTLTLDRLCRKAALSSFSRMQSDDLLLFINIDTSILKDSVVGSGHLLEMVGHYGISPGMVVIEINESCVNDTGSLIKFIDTYRRHGFIIALDDVGKGYSNLNRVSMTRPDILKIDKSLVRDLHREYYKQEVFKSLIHLSRSIGALSVAEGVESPEEASVAMGCGVDMLQGFYFARPEGIHNFSLGPVQDKIKYTARKFKGYMLQKLSGENALKRKYERIASNICHKLQRCGAAGFDFALTVALGDYDSIECLYVLDEKGIQVSSTVCSRHVLSARKRPAFRPAPRGTDHSLKDYYYILTGAGLPVYITEPYISLATGNLCTTISAAFESPGYSRFILCIDAVSNMEKDLNNISPLLF